jgi:hypothetical protein
MIRYSPNLAKGVYYLIVEEMVGDAGSQKVENEFNYRRHPF